MTPLYEQNRKAIIDTLKEFGDTGATKPVLIDLIQESHDITPEDIEKILGLLVWIQAVEQIRFMDRKNKQSVRYRVNKETSNEQT